MQFLFWMGFILMAHSYVVYPMLLLYLARGKKLFKQVSHEPKVIVLMAVYNAGQGIQKKVESVLNSSYPHTKILFYIGSDCSTDATDTILYNCANSDNRIRFTRFDSRTGKIGVINALYEKALSENKSDECIFISTDVTAIFHKDCIRELVSCFADEKVGVVGSYIVKGDVRADGISGQEKAYYKRELEMKYHEGVLWGSAMGVFGACFAIKPNVFTRVPTHYLVDDFFISMSALQKGYKVVQDNQAYIYMNVPNDSSIEYRRKVRIAAGNFQNLKHFSSMLFTGSTTAFAYWSHKVIRWLGPFFILMCLISSSMLVNHHFIYKAAFYVQAFLLLTPLFNYLLKTIHIHNPLLRFASHFYTMNAGILMGFIKYIRGIRSSVWEPTARN
jgi:cellulose synthase/poly-beta-1,6-N-acetylglucosamine synthase-like glycosyltransferase